MSTWTRIAVSAALIAPIALAAPVALAELAASPVQEQPRCCSLCATRVVRRPRGTSRRCCWRVWSGWTRRPRYAIGPSPGPDAPDRATLDFTRATSALDRGDLALARSLLDDVVAARPLAGSAWLARTTAGDMAPAQEDRLLALHDRAFATVPTAERAPALYAAGQVLHRRGAHDRAFAHFAAGAAMRRQSLRHDRVADAASAAVATHGTTRARPASNQGRAIFVVGLPRSGTTLVEQILTAHSHVAGGGELNLMRLVAQDAGGPNAAAVEAYEARGGSRADLSALYHHLLDQRFGPDGRIVDKTLNGSRLLGLIDAVLPDSPIIWVRRDPLDCAWSCLRTHFALGAAWSLDQRDMADHMKLEDQLFARWCDLLGERILPVDYAALVDDPAAQIARILAHCGLPEEPGPFAPEDNARAVTTSSVVQVRRPINRSGIGTAGPYEAHLVPFVAAYAR
ncbi:sulfotransferase [Sphingomonas sp. HHU CXW]|uniref:Sulfotransferase n=1 Tax=Sphingomonas hominis TaxID=2741495 RepID=A0ABX2JLY1_9SPHN|nr:sulfotransferase [Sphingomonas hominis]NTS66676.1 sulfotransferase [Sphingomonas hominis]